MTRDLMTEFLLQKLITYAADAHDANHGKIHTTHVHDGFLTPNRYH